MGPDGVTSDSPTKEGCELLHVLAGLLLLILPRNGTWEWRGRETWLPALGKLEVLAISYYDFFIFLLMAGHESGLCKHWWFDCQVLIGP